MDAKELRIGNYVKRIDTSEIIIVKGAVAFGINPYTNYEFKDEQEGFYVKSGLDDDNISPIPLTEEILLACGFEKDSDPLIWTSYNKKGFCKRLRLINHIDGNYYQFGLENGSVNIFSLHQLQNLYFALTNKELEVMLEKPIWEKLDDELSKSFDE